MSFNSSTGMMELISQRATTGQQSTLLDEPYRTAEAEGSKNVIPLDEPYRTAKAEEYARAQMKRHWIKKERKLAFMNAGIKLGRVLYAILKEHKTYDPKFELSKVNSLQTKTEAAGTPSPKANQLPDGIAAGQVKPGVTYSADQVAKLLGWNAKIAKQLLPLVQEAQ